MIELEQIIQSLVNPATGKTLHEEKRIQKYDFNEQTREFSLLYKRDGINPEQKRVIEDELIVKLEGLIDEDKITVETISGDGEMVKAPQKEQASLNVGHGPMGVAKKRVPHVKKVLGVSSCTGGVGKSTVALNLALSLQRLGYKVGVLDSDIYGPSMPTLMGMKSAKPTAKEDKKIAPFEAHGLEFMSFGHFIDEKEPVIWRGPMLGGVLNQFLFDCAWGDLDVLLVDLPPGTGDMQLSLSQLTEVDGVIVVSTPQEVALVDAKKGLEMFRKLNIPVLGMVENMSYFVADESDKKYFIFGEGGVEKACHDVDTPFLGALPLEMALRESCDQGIPYMTQEKYAERPLWREYLEFASRVQVGLGLESPPEKKKGFWGKLLS